MSWTYTAAGLVTHCKNALKLKTKYMWAGTLAYINDAYIDQKVRQCKSVPASRSGYTEQRIRQLHAIANRGYYGVDCVCLVKSYYWSGKPDGGTGSPKYEGSTDLNAGGMYSAAKVKGAIGTLPERPGLILISKTHGNHIGVYIGNGETIESTLGARGDGVVKHKLDKTFWTDWFECPFISYAEQKTQGEPLQSVQLAYDAVIRDRPSYGGKRLGLLSAGTKCVIVKGAEYKDSVSGYIYVKLGGGKSQWIVKSAIKPS